MRWSHFKTFVDTYKLKIHWRLSGDTGSECYKLVASDGMSGLTHTCVLDYESPAPVGSNQEDFELNYKAAGNVSSSDQDNTPLSRQKLASLGWTLHARHVERHVRKNVEPCSSGRWPHHRFSILPTWPR